MANIAAWLTKIKNAIYGEEMRGAIHDSIEAVNADVEGRLNLDQTTPQKITKVDSLKVEGNIVTYSPEIENINTTLSQSEYGVFMVPIGDDAIYKFSLIAAKLLESNYWGDKYVYATPFDFNVTIKGVTLDDFTANDVVDNVNGYTFSEEVGWFYYQIFIKNSQGLWVESSTYAEITSDSTLDKKTIIINWESNGSEFYIFRTNVNTNVTNGIYTNNTTLTDNVLTAWLEPISIVTTVDISADLTVLLGINAQKTILQYHDIIEINSNGEYALKPTQWLDIMEYEYDYPYSLSNVYNYGSGYIYYPDEYKYPEAIVPYICDLLPYPTEIDNSVLETGVFSSVAVGVPAFKIRSNAMIKNLNAEMLGGLTFAQIQNQLPNQNVGINSTPTFRGMTFKNSVGTTTITVDADKGYIKQKVPFAYLLFNGSNGWNVPAGVTATKFTGFNLYDNRILPVPSTGNSNITIDRVGYYKISFNCCLMSNTSDVAAIIAIYKNDVEYLGIKSNTTIKRDIRNHIAFDFIMPIGSTSTIDVRLWHSWGSICNFTIYNVYLSVEYVGEL